jgi:hypothetical protein
MARLHTAKWFEHRAFFKNLSGGGHLQKGTRYYTSVERWQMVLGDKTFGVVSYVLVGGILPQKIVCIFPLLGLKCEHSLKQTFGLHCALIERIWPVKCTCMVCLCKYHNWVTQGVGSLLNLVGPTPTRRNHGWRRAGKILKFWVSRSLKMAFSESSFVIIEIRTPDMVFKIKNFFDPPFLCLKTFLTPLFIRVKLRLPPLPFTNPPVVFWHLKFKEASN